MKKLLFTVCALAIALGATACAKRAPNPSTEPSELPTVSQQPSVSPSAAESVLPSVEESAVPSEEVTPSLEPSAEESILPSEEVTPSDEPSLEPSATESLAPSEDVTPSLEPSAEESTVPSEEVTPSDEPSLEPSATESLAPSEDVTPSLEPSAEESILPSEEVTPSLDPSVSVEPVTVRFVTDGSAVENLTVLPGEPVGTLPLSEKADMDFAGWYSGANLEIKLTETTAFLEGETPEYTAVFVKKNAILFTRNAVYSGVAETDGCVASITAAGEYFLSGECNDGQVTVNAPAELVVLHLEGLNLTCSTSAPIYCEDAEKLTVTLAAGTQNSLKDSDRLAAKPKGVLHSKADLKINGTGTLDVYGYNFGGVRCGADLKIEDVELFVYAVGDAITADGEMELCATISVNAGGDGVRTETYDSLKEKKGNLILSGGSLTVVSGEDGVQAERNFTMTAGELFVTSGGGNEVASTGVGDGVKANGTLTVTGGVMVVTAAEDGVKSGGTATDKDGVTLVTLTGGITVANAEVTVYAGCDGVQSDGAIAVENATLSVEAGNALNNVDFIKQRGVKADGDISFKNSTLTVVSNSDGVNSDGAIVFYGGNAEVSSKQKDAVQGTTKVELVGATLICRAKKPDKATPANLVKDAESVFTAAGLL